MLRRTERARMTRRQMQVLERAVAGRSLKEIGAALSVHPATVCNHLRAALSVLGASRAEAILLLSSEGHLISNGESLEMSLAGSIEGATGFTRAEREVVAGVLRGLSNDAIALQRGCATRTVANLLARAFRKSGAQSRNELIARFAHTNRNK